MYPTLPLAAPIAFAATAAAMVISHTQQSNQLPINPSMLQDGPGPFNAEQSSSKASFPSPPAPGSRLATGETGFLLLVCHDSLSLLCIVLYKAGLTYTTTIDKAKQGQVLRNSFRIHRPVWATAGGAMYTTAGAVYLTLRYLRRVR